MMFKLMSKKSAPVLVVADNYEILKNLANERFKEVNIELFYDSKNDLEVSNQEEFDDLLKHWNTKEIPLLVDYSNRLSVDEKRTIFSNSKKVDFCIMMNASRFNKKYIDSLPNNFVEKIEEIKKKYTDLDIRIGFILYYDSDEDAEFFDFQNYDSQNFEELLSKIRIGENVRCKNFMSGMIWLNALSWSRQTRVLFHLCDTPYYLKDNELRALNYFKENKLNYYFCKTNEDTNKMIEQFNEIFIEISCMRLNICECNDKDSFLYSIQRSICESVLTVEKISIKRPDDDDDDDLIKINVSIKRGVLKEDEFLKHEADLEVISIDEESFKKFISGKERGKIENYITKKSTKIKVSKSKNPFDRGNVRQAFLVYLHSKNGDLKCVAKKSLCRKKKYRRYKYFLNILCTQIVSQFLAKIYEASFNNADKLLLYLNVALLKINNEYYTVEKYIEHECFKKWDYSLNFLNKDEDHSSYVKLYSSTLDAFSHWTFSVSSEDFLLVTDLQGIEYEENGQKEFILTDPVIHCLNQQFDRTDLGEDGILDFLKSHICNKFCNELRLKTYPMQPKDRILDFTKHTDFTKHRSKNRQPLFKDFNYDLLF